MICVDFAENSLFTSFGVICRRFTIGKTMLTLERPASRQAVMGLGACAVREAYW